MNLRNKGSKRDELKIKIAIRIKLKNNSFGLNKMMTDEINNIKIIGIEVNFLSYLKIVFRIGILFLNGLDLYIWIKKLIEIKIVPKTGISRAIIISLIEKIN